MRRAFDSGRSVALAAVGLATMVLAGCQLLLGIDDPATDADAVVPSSFTVGVVAIGTTDSLALRLDAGDDSTLLDIAGDGVYQFDLALADGTSYEVSPVGSPPCDLGNEMGLVAGADVDVVVLCEGVLENIEVSDVPDLGFSGAQHGYATAVSLFRRNVTVTVSAISDEVDLGVSGTPVTSQSPSPALALDIGDNPIAVSVSHALGAALDYSVVVTRTVDLVETTYAKASNTGISDLLGESVAVDGDTIAVGAAGEDSPATGVNGNQGGNTAADSGAVYVFRKVGESWSQEAYIKASNTSSLDLFGRSVALYGDTLAVGARSEDSDATGVNGNQNSEDASNSGAVYVFQRTGTEWQQVAYIKASNTERDDHFGTSVALHGDTLAVGAPDEDSNATGVAGNPADNSATDSGAVYVFRRDGQAWTQEAYLKASNTAGGDAFGSSVAVFEDHIAVGAPLDDGVASSSGSVHSFRRSNGIWTPGDHLMADNAGSTDQFGGAVALSGELMVVGAHAESSSASGVNGDGSNNNAAGSGAAYVFRFDGQNWTQEAYLKASNTNSSDWFGTSVAVSGNTIVVGASREDSSSIGFNGAQDNNDAATSGAAYLFTHDGQGWTQSAYIKSINSEIADGFGAAVALSDGICAITAIYEDGGATGIDGNAADNSRATSGALYIYE